MLLPMYLGVYALNVTSLVTKFRNAGKRRIRIHPNYHVKSALNIVIEPKAIRVKLKN